MSIVDRERFLQGVAKSGVLTEDAHDQWVAGIDSETSAKDLARDLVGKKLVTVWQAKMLLKGANRLTLGNFLLTDRLGKSEFGDQFSATHRQLSRDVSIQYLPNEVSSSSESKKEVFEFGSKLSELDHPNLVHVYDIDEERDRIYLVSECTGGMPLKELLADPSKLSGEAVGKIVLGCVRGVRYAHSKGVILSGISDETVLVKPDGDSQITGLTRHAIRNHLSKSPISPDKDFSAIDRIARMLVDSLSANGQAGDVDESLRSAIGLIATEPEEAQRSLEEFVKNISANDIDEMQLAPEVDRAPVTSHPATALASERKFAHGDGSSTQEEMNAEGYLTSLARKNPVALLAVSALISILMIGGTVFAATRLVAKPETAMAAAPKIPANGNTDAKDTPKKKKPSRKGKKRPAKVERPDFRNTKGALSEKAPVNLADDTVTDPKANMAAIDAIFKKEPVKKDVPVEVTHKVSTSPTPKGDALAIEPVAKDSAAKTVAATPAPKEPPKSQTKKQADEPEYLAAGKNPFEKFAKMVDLPEISSAEPTSFGKLILEKKHLLGAEILSTPMAHRSKPIFEMSRSAEDRQTWDISYRKKKRSDPVLIAKLQKTPRELRFSWVPEAAEVSAANYLRNCRFKLSTATHSHWLTLRKPIKIDGFKLPKDSGTVKLDFEIPHMPSPAALSAGLNGIKFERQNKEDWEERAHLEPSEITPKVPARMYFHKDADRFLSLDVIADIRKKLKLQAALVMQPSPDQPGVVLPNPGAFSQIALEIRQMAQRAQAESQRAQASKLKGDEKKLFSDAAKKATDRAELTGYYEHVVPQLLEKDIPVTITYALNDQHRILLAYTVENDDTKEK